LRTDFPSGNRHARLRLKSEKSKNRKTNPNPGPLPQQALFLPDQQAQELTAGCRPRPVRLTLQAI
jgi:hypothetical protein